MKSFALFFAINLIFIGGSAFGASRSQACVAEAKRLCPNDLNDEIGLEKCLENAKGLSAECANHFIPCAADKRKHCAGKAWGSGLEDCLLSHSSGLRRTCKLAAEYQISMRSRFRICSKDALKYCNGQAMEKGFECLENNFPNLTSLCKSAVYPCKQFQENYCRNLTWKTGLADCLSKYSAKLSHDCKITVLERLE